MIYTALIFGLASSLHCVGMCGPIAFMLPLDRTNASRKLLQLFFYHMGRLCSYTFLGLIFGLLGRGLYLAGLQQRLSIVMGAIIIALALIPEKRWGAILVSPGLRFVSAVKSGLGKRLQDRRLSSLFLLGNLNGLLPCGMVYAALFAAMALQGIPLGMAYMALFGLGTFPLMVAVSYYAQSVTVASRSKITNILPVISVCIGILFIARGLDLGIPYLSPDNISLFVKPVPDCH